MPFVVVVLLVISSLAPDPPGESSPGGTLKVSAPPNAQAQASNCAKLLAVLPVQLGKLDQRIVQVTPEIPSVVAWGNPAIVLRCGAARPKDLVPGSAAQLQPGGDLSGPWYDITRDGDANVWTTVDRAPYISITVPGKYVAEGPITTLSGLIRKTLPAVCSTDANAPVATLCTRRP